MEVTYASATSAGSVRTNNEDRIQFVRSEEGEERLQRGVLAVLADGAGGHGFGEVASQLAVDTVVRLFGESPADATPNQLLWRTFNAANLAVYDQGMTQQGSGERRMATTLTALLFRYNEVFVGHVGDCRAYLIHQGKIERLTTDHSYVGMQVKMGLLSEHDAATSDMRTMLTRLIGQNPTVQVDFNKALVHEGDVVVQCCDGVHGCVTENEICEMVLRQSPDEACKHLLDMAIKRGSEDNVTVQIIRIDKVNQVGYYRGVPVFHEESKAALTGEPQVGQVLDARFEITDLISRSGMGSIFKAVDLENGDTVALKVPFMHFESDPAFYARFQREEEIGRSLDHPGILKIRPMSEKRSRPYFAMEYLRGRTLDEVIRAEEKVPVDKALSLVSRLCEALDYMHKRDIVHRDLKPANIMVCDDGSTRIMDFGIAKAQAMRRITFGGFSPTMGTPDYMAPEQVKGKRGDGRTDLYSLGAILYEMVTGRVPFEAPNAYMVMNARLIGDPRAPRRINPEISPQVEEIILHAMERDPIDRYANAAEMKADLDSPDKVALTGRHERLRPPMMWKSRWKKVRQVVIILGVIGVVFGLMILMFRGQKLPH
jgi:serine/threonine protein phosphatase PrpC